MGTGTLFISLSHAGRVLAMPGPDCPALSWRQEGGMIIACAFWGRWLSMHSEDILGHGIATHQIDCQALKFETFLPLWAQVHYSSNCPMQAACLQCRRQLTHPVLTWRQEGKNMDHFFFLEVGSECIQTTSWNMKLQQNHIGSRTVSLETFLPCAESA